MSKKLLSLLLIGLLLLGGLMISMPVFAGDNEVNLSGFGGATGVTPFVEKVRVRYGRMGNSVPSLSSGDVVMWDTNSADGITITACNVTGDTGSFAGVLLGDIQSADSATVNANARNWGWIAVRGYCLAKVDTSSAQTGQKLFQNGGVLEGSFGTTGLLTATEDQGTLLSDTGTDGLMPVFLQ